jgi:hypothetical protein
MAQNHFLYHSVNCFSSSTFQLFYHRRMIDLAQSVPHASLWSSNSGPILFDWNENFLCKEVGLPLNDCDCNRFAFWIEV